MHVPDVLASIRKAASLIRVALTEHPVSSMHREALWQRGSRPVGVCIPPSLNYGQALSRVAFVSLLREIVEARVVDDLAAGRAYVEIADHRVPLAVTPRHGRLPICRLNFAKQPVSHLGTAYFRHVETCRSEHKSLAL